MALAHTELKDKDYIKCPHFLFSQFQLVLQQDDAALFRAEATAADNVALNSTDQEMPAHTNSLCAQTSRKN